MSELEQQMHREFAEHEETIRFAAEVLHRGVWLLGAVLGLNEWLRALGQDGR